MKKFSCIILALIIVAQLISSMSILASSWSWGSDGKYEVASYNAAIVKNDSIEVDAVRDHEYLSSTKITEYPELSPYTRSGYSSVVGDAKGNFEAYVVVDTKGMYIYAEIEDSTIFATTNSNGNDGDYISIYFDWIGTHPTPEERSDSWSASDYLNNNKTDQKLGWLSADYYGNIVGSRGFSSYTKFGPNKNQSILYEAQIVEGGWVCEWFVPWRSQAQCDAVSKGEQFHCGIGFQVGDDSDIKDTATPGKEQDVIIRFDQRKELGLSYYLDYSKLADLTFVQGHEETYRVCTSSGLADLVCEECDIVIKENVSVSVFDEDPKSHVYIWSAESSASTCANDGKEIFLCKYCDAIKTTEIPALGHNYEYSQREAKHVCNTCRARVDHGDTNGDGHITNADVLEMYKYIYNPITYPIDYPEIADANFDGSVTNSDILLIYKYIYNPGLYPIVEKQDDVIVDGINLSDYVIVYPASNSLGEKKLAEVLATRIKEKYGLEMDIYEDSAELFEYEIIIGRSDRDESRAIYASSFEYDQYSVSVSDKKISVGFADNKFAAEKAIEDIGNMITVSKSVTSKTVRAVANKLLNSACFSDMHNTFTMLEPNNSTGDYVLRKTHVRAVELIREKYGLLDVVMVGGDLMSDYPRWDESGCWPYKYYVEYKQLLVDLFAGLTKDGKVMYVAGNHDYAQGELATDAPHTATGNYNSSEFYFTGPMNATLGVLNDKDMHWVVGTHTGDKYLLGYHYEVNGVHFFGLAPDPDNPNIWSKQTYGFHTDTLEWFKNRLEEIDPDGDEIIFVNCHYHMAHRVNDVISGGQADKDFLPIIKGHRNLFWMYGHVHTGEEDIAQSHTSEMVVHYDNKGNTINSPAIADSYGNAENRGPTTVYMGAGRIDYNSKYFGTDKVYGYGGYSSGNNTYSTTATPKICQVMYFTVYEDRVVFQSINVGTYTGYTENDIIAPYTVYLYK